jgi:putative Ca2+/H+ antiporter (TMEM165/GDT1 family)
VTSTGAARARLGGGCRSAVDVPASLAGAGAAAVTAAAIYLGSRSLRTFDAALVGYATATIFLAFGVAYRYVVWVRSPPAMR